MEDLYDNLENYHDEKIIDELKIENINLKIKLEEYSSAMIRLQHDFDNLNSDYKKLELNYSSLLKTARAEIERKSHMIQSLNLEKDQLVIKTLQSSGQNTLRNRRPNFNDIQESNKSHAITTPLLDRKNDGKSHLNNRINATRTQSEDTASSLENKSNFSEDKESKNTNYYTRNKKDKTKEIHKNMQCSTYKAQNIYNRRKSMPMNRYIEPIYSSDDDFEALRIKKMRQSPLKEDTRYTERYNNRENYYNSSKDVYRNKTDNGVGHDKYRRDNYESCKKYKRRSPERCPKYIKEYPETRKYTDKNNTQRVLKSPPTDKYNRSKSRDRLEKRFSFEKEKYYDNDRHSLLHPDYLTTKHKIRNEHDEPTNKRQKTESSNTSVAKENISNTNMMKELDLTESFPKPLKDFTEPSSCQSPDYDNIDSTIISQHVVKEIKPAMSAPLEDPRVSSKKYAMKTNKEKAVLSTIVGENIDIKPVNVSIWDMPNIKSFTLPATLPKKLPEETDRNVTNEMYMNIDDAVLNESLESGEIKSLKDYDIYGTKSINEDKSDVVDSLKIIDSNKSQKPVAKKYKIPKAKKTDQDMVNSAVKHDEFETLMKKHDSANKCCKINNENIEVERENCLKVKTEHEIHNIKNLQNGENDKSEKIKKSGDEILYNEPDNTVAIGTLADDLELSDDTSECKKFQKEAKKSRKNSTKERSTSTELNKHHTELQSYKDESKHKEQKLKETSKSVNSKKVQSKESSRETGKGRKSKKKIEQKENHTEAKEQNKELQEVSKHEDKIRKPAFSSQIRNKFGDLFGDSSSLITPDDLGIASTEIQLPLGDKYVPIFDNTQDAVDLRVENINRTQCDTVKASSIQSFVEELANDKKITEKTGSDSGNVLVFKDCDTNATNKNMSVNTIYANLKSETSNDSSEIVKTVIISSGVQPKYACKDEMSKNDKKMAIEYIDSISNGNTNTKKCASNNINALATSTPQKTAHENISTTLQNPNLPNDSSIITEKQNLSNTSFSNHYPDKATDESDIPDVRIFVRRRRKINKKL